MFLIIFWKKINRYICVGWGPIDIADLRGRFIDFTNYVM